MNIKILVHRCSLLYSVRVFTIPAIGADSFTVCVLRLNYPQAYIVAYRAIVANPFPTVTAVAARPELSRFCDSFAIKAMHKIERNLLYHVIYRFDRRFVIQ